MRFEQQYAVFETERNFRFLALACGLDSQVFTRVSARKPARCGSN